MKRYHIIVLIGIASLLTGCIGDDYSNCPVFENLILKPVLYDGEGVSLLVKKVSSIDAFVYDTDNHLVICRRVVKNRENQFPDIRFAVTPGDYRVVCWGNIGEEMRMVGPDDGLTLDKSYLETVSDKTGSPLYYAPKQSGVGTGRDGPPGSGGDDDGKVDYGLYKVVVASRKITTREMLFTRAHRTVRVYLKNYETVHEAEAPGICFTHMPVRSDFFLRTDPLRKDYEQVTLPVMTGEGFRMMVSFNTLIAPFTEDMLIKVIRSSDRETVTVVNLKRYVEDHALKIEDMNEFNIEIYYLMNGLVEINFPAWGDTPLEPDW